MLIDRLHKMQPPPAAAEVPRELSALEEAVRKVETEAARQEPDELSVPKRDLRQVPARLAADPQEAVSALERDADGRPRHRWPAFIHAQPQPDPSPKQSERLKRFAVVREAEAPNSKRDPLWEPAKVLEQDEDAFVWPIK